MRIRHLVAVLAILALALAVVGRLTVAGPTNNGPAGDPAVSKSETSPTLTTSLAPSLPPSHVTVGAPQPTGFAQAGATLGDGRVLVVGEREADIYDPTTHHWSVTGTLRSYHYGYHTVVPLKDGNVLVVGGDSDPRTSAELYLTRRGRWIGAGVTAVGRSEAMATRLADGRVLVAGGVACTVNGFCSTTSSAEVYDPASNSWHATGRLVHARQDATATLLRNGEVLVAGGLVCEPCVVSNTAELYDPKSGTWRPTGNMHIGHELHSATLLKDGQVLVAGGDDFSRISSGSIPYAEIYDPATGRWHVIPPMSVGRKLQGATLLPNGDVLMTGGEHAGIALRSTEIYDPKANVWRRTGNLRSKRVGHMAILLRDGRVLIAGGNTLGAPSTRFELFRVRL